MRACTRRLAPGQAWLGGRLGGVALLFVLVFLPPSLRRSISTSLGALWARCPVRGAGGCVISGREVVSGVGRGSPLQSPFLGMATAAKHHWKALPHVLSNWKLACDITIYVPQKVPHSHFSSSDIVCITDVQSTALRQIRPIGCSCTSVS